MGHSSFLKASAIENEYHGLLIFPCTEILENSSLLLIIIVGQQSIHLKAFYQNNI